MTNNRPNCCTPKLTLACTIAPTPTGHSEALMLITTPQLDAGQRMCHLIVGHLRLPDPSDATSAYLRNGTPIRCGPAHAEIRVAADGRVKVGLGRSWWGPLPAPDDWVNLATSHHQALMAIGTVPRPAWMDIDAYLDRHAQHAALCFVTVTRTPAGAQ